MCLEANQKQNPWQPRFIVTGKPVKLIPVAFGVVNKRLAAGQPPMTATLRLD